MSDEYEKVTNIGGIVSIFVTLTYNIFVQDMLRSFICEIIAIAKTSFIRGRLICSPT